MYLLRLDDASEYWNRKNWVRMADLLNKYKIKPIFAIIPNNEDSFLLEYGKDYEFEDTIHKWIDNDWTPALHGYNHVMNIADGGINPINTHSEFAGLELSKQKEKLSEGINILHNKGIYPKIFVAPGHTFDRNTLRALKDATNIRIISDTIARDIYKKDGLWFIPQQSGKVRNLNFKVVTFCYHPNTMKEEDFLILEKFLQKNKENFIGVEDLQFKECNLSFYDRVLRRIYFIRHKMAVKKWEKKQKK